MAKTGLYKSFSKYRQVCIQNNFFASGTNDQYEKVHDLLQEKGLTLHELSLITWLCSSDYSYAEISAILENSL